jgi:circadian clock protein KaiC
MVWLRPDGLIHASRTSLTIATDAEELPMTTRLSTGIKGLDEVLHGGLLPGQIFMVRGVSGSGKTTLAMQFLMEGARRGEPGLFIGLTESEAELRNSSAARGWSLDGIHLLDLHPGGDEAFSPDSQYTIYHPADVELAPTTRKITEAMERLRPARVVFDNLTEVGFLTRDAPRFRRQVLGLRDFLLASGATTLFLGESNHRQFDIEILSIVHGVINLERARGRHGMARRSLEVEKYRDSEYDEGVHALRTTPGGLEVYPHLLATEHRQDFVEERTPSGVAGLDRMLGGGIDRGTSLLLSGNAGAGKTSLGVTILAEAARRGERAVLYSFEEGTGRIARRCEGLGIAIKPLIEGGLLALEKVNPLLLYPDEFAANVRAEVEQKKAQAVMIDSLNGYRRAMPDEDYLVGHMLQLTSYLSRMGVATILTEELPLLTGDVSLSVFGLSHLIDAVVLLKYFEHRGGLRRAIGVVKNRSSDHEKDLRRLEITSQGIRVGEPLPHLRGILRGEAESDGEPAARDAAALEGESDG